MLHPRLIIISALCFVSFLMMTECETTKYDHSEDFHIENLTTDNYPKVDGSTSTEPLQVIIACKLLGVEYAWVYHSFFWKYPYRVMPACDIKPNVGRYITERINHAGTHGSYINLINGWADLILVARIASEDELHEADSLGVNLIEVPVALDAFVFLNNIHNSVNNLSTQQIQDIYTGQITQWNEVGGEDKEIHPYQRNENSGSQELMKALVMKDLAMPDMPDLIAYGMMGLINMIEIDPLALGYSVHFYTRYMIRSDSANLISVDNVYPGYNEIKNRKYGYTSEVYAVIREDLDESSSAYKLFELLVENSGQSIVKESGYIPYY